eukprot:6199014-Pleurochrysis_carterae.AAC.2
MGLGQVVLKTALSVRLHDAFLHHAVLTYRALGQLNGGGDLLRVANRGDDFPRQNATYGNELSNPRPLSKHFAASDRLKLSIVHEGNKL